MISSILLWEVAIAAIPDPGKLIFEVGYDQAQAVRDIMARNGYQDLQTTMDPGMHWRVVEGSVEQEAEDEKMV